MDFFVYVPIGILHCYGDLVLSDSKAKNNPYLAHRNDIFTAHGHL